MSKTNPPVANVSAYFASKGLTQTSIFNGAQNYGENNQLHSRIWYQQFNTPQIARSQADRTTRQVTSRDEEAVAAAVEFIEAQTGRLTRDALVSFLASTGIHKHGQVHLLGGQVLSQIALIDVFIDAVLDTCGDGKSVDGAISVGTKSGVIKFWHHTGFFHLGLVMKTVTEAAIEKWKQGGDLGRPDYTNNRNRDVTAVLASSLADLPAQMNKRNQWERENAGRITIHQYRDPVREVLLEAVAKAAGRIETGDMVNAIEAMSKVPEAMRPAALSFLQEVEDSGRGGVGGSAYFKPIQVAGQTGIWVRTSIAR